MRKMRHLRGMGALTFALACVAVTASTAPSFADPVIGKDFQTPMAFSFQTDSAGNQQIFATGQIFQDSGVKLKAMLDQNKVKPGSIIILHSPGGAADIGMEMGRLIRARGLHTRVGQRPQARAHQLASGDEPFNADPGECDSACTLAFLGGLRRTVPPGSKYGIHDVYIPNNQAPSSVAFNAGQVTFGEMSAYVQSMGIDAEFMLFASRYDSSKGEVYYVPASFLDKWRVTTIDLGTKWDLTIRGGEFQLIGVNPDSTQFAREHDEIVVACRGQPRRLEMTATYVTPSRSVFTASLTSEAFAASVKDIKIAIAKAQQANAQAPAAEDAAFVMPVAPGDILERPRAIKTHSIQTKLIVRPPVIPFLQSAQEINVQFYTSDKDYYGFVMTLPTDRTEITEFAQACK
jgi:hypothetical protein